MKRILSLLLVASLSLTGDTAPPDLGGKSLKETFETLLPKLDSNAEQQKWQSICTQLGAPGNDKLRAEACQLMAGKLDDKTPLPTRLWLLNQLRQIGRAECLEALTPLLADKNDLVRDAAIRALAANPSPSATEVLTAALTGNEKTRPALLSALGYRADKAATRAIAELLTADPATAVAAASALGRIDAPEARAALQAARAKCTGPTRLAISNAILQHADRLLAGKKTSEAATIYKELNQPEESRGVRLAALRGTLATSDDAGPTILGLFTKGTADERAIAVASIEALPVAALKTLADDLEKLPVPSQVQVLTALAARGEKTARTAAMTAARSSNEPVRRAGLQALGRLGDAGVVPLLLEALGTPALAEIATDSLVQLSGDGIDASLIAALESEKAPARAGALIAVLERRKAGSAIPAILKAASGDDATVRAAAFAGLKGLAEPKHLPEILAAFLKTQAGKDREPAELVIVSIAGQMAEPGRRSEAVLARLGSGSKEDRVALLPLAGRLGGERILAAVKDALGSTDADQARAGFVALCNWPGPEVSPDLLKLAQGAKEPGERQQALRALIRVQTIPGEYPNPDRVSNLQKAMDAAMRDDERRLTLEAFGTVRDLASLRYVLPYLENKALDQAACKAIVELAHSRMLREPNRAEFVKALDRVIAQCKDKGLVDRAKQYKQQ